MGRDCPIHRPYAFVPRKAWRSINKLTGRSRPPLGDRTITANAIASQLVNNGAYSAGNKDMDRHVSREVSELWKIPTPPDHNIFEEFSDNELTSALNFLKAERHWAQIVYTRNLFSMKAKH